MPVLTLSSETLPTLRDWLRSDTLLVACLCAGWCDACRDYRTTFEALAARHPEQHFLWIDIEDQADLLGDFDVENFPTLLVQRGAQVAFFGTVVPALAVADRLLQSLVNKSLDELAADTAASAERQRWRDHKHLAARLAAG
ncbi:thioredoxin 1 [Actimicrobium sp. GrIS 1.19]|uniref:thioredoxin family protein n=1 Tax=Actimicrobium sp. GrIS 1.19 TaxID=3071708 RepID=UPI002E0B5C53|nr:thioredoxin 1 [Actimicrobium sp. GrIS 1.19]